MTERKRFKEMTIIEALEHSDMQNIKDYYPRYTCEYRGNKIEILICDCRADLKTRFALNINDKKLATRCNYRTLIKLIKSYRD